MIDRYLRGELAGEELEDFTKNLSDDPGLAEDVAFQSEVNELISVNAYHELRNQMSSDIANIDKGSSSKGFNRTISVILIAGLLSIAGGYFLLKDNDKESSGLSKNDNQELVNTDNIPSLKLTEAENNATAFEQDQSASRVTNPKKSSKNINDDNGVEIQDNAESLSRVSADTFVLPYQPTTINETNKEVKEPVSTISDKSELNADPCAKAVIKARWTISEACQARNDGKIEIDENLIQGGEEPYRIDLYSGSQKVDPSDLDHLYSGNYTLKITDVNGCLGKWNVKLLEKNCQPTGVSFSPTQGETWAFNGNDRNSYYLSIYNQAGQLIFKSSLLSGIYEWSGISNAGSMVETGFYVYVVEYTNGKKENGQITVIR